MYSLLSEDECAAILESIERAYAVLSSENGRREYDRDFDSRFLDPSPAAFAPVAAASGGGFFGDTDLVAPSTALSDDGPFGAPLGGSDSPVERRAEIPVKFAEVPLPAPVSETRASLNSDPLPRLEPVAVAVASSRGSPTAHSTPSTYSPRGTRPAPREYAPETEWTGPLLRSLREEAAIPIEEMVAQTRVSKTYLRAIEDEDFAKLPATVFTRGFITQIARTLKLPVDRVVPAYIGRLERAKAPK